MINWMVLVVVAILALNVYLGYRNGFLKVMLSLVGWIVILGVAVTGSPYLCTWICKNTSIDEVINKKIMDRTPGKELIIDFSGMFKEVAANITSVVVTGIAFVIILLIGIVVYILLRKALGWANKIPIIGGVDKSAGAAAGFLKGCVLVWIIFTVASFNSSTEYGQQIVTMINESKFLKTINDNNVILSTILSML